MPNPARAAATTRSIPRNAHFLLSLVASLLAAPTVAAPLAAQQTSIRGFADVTFQGGHGGDSRPAGFQLGQYDLYISSRISERVSFLGETVFEFGEGDWHADVERIVLSYAVSPKLHLSAGKHHTPIGYWNTAYHHGALLQPTIDRPEMFRFEDDGGILPIHSTGLAASGHGIGPMGLGYDLMVANRLGSTPEGDRQDAKAYTAGLHIRPFGALEIGASAHLDQIPTGAIGPQQDTLTARVKQQIVGGYLAWSDLGSDVIAEYQQMRNTADGLTAHTTDAMYAYAGHRIGIVTPYVRYDAISGTAGDPWVAPLGTADVHQGLVGTRFDLSSNAALKFEARRRREASNAASTIGAVQFSIWF